MTHNWRSSLTSTNTMIKAIMCPLSGDTSLDDHRRKYKPLTGEQKQKILRTGNENWNKKVEIDRNRLPPRFINSFYRCSHIVQTSLCLNAAGNLKEEEKWPEARLQERSWRKIIDCWVSVPARQILTRTSKSKRWFWELDRQWIIFLHKISFPELSKMPKHLRNMGWN